LISIEGKSENQLEPGQDYAPVTSYCSLLRNPLPKPTCVLEHSREGETNCWFSSLGGVSFWPHPYGDEGR